MLGPYPLPVEVQYTQEQVYVQFERGKLTLSAEWRTNPASAKYGPAPAGYVSIRGWYVMSSYHLTDRLTLGAYYSDYWILMSGDRNRNSPANHQQDVTLNGRLDINRYFYLKMEGHYLRGTCSGFYLQTNPNGLQKDTRLFLARVGFVI